VPQVIVSAGVAQGGLESTRDNGSCRMRKVAVFGNTGGGKSTLARRLAELTQLPLYPLDLIQWEPGGVEVPHAEYLKAHKELLSRDAWIIDGYGCFASAWERFSAADTLIYIDLPLFTHFRWVTKRFFNGLFVNPEGWPENSPVWSSAMNCYRVLWRCHRHLTPRYRELVADAAASKRVYHLRTPAGMKAFLEAVKRERPNP
jgi:adenylate kinase family enzyme